MIETIIRWANAPGDGTVHSGCRFLLLLVTVVCLYIGYLMAATSLLEALGFEKNGMILGTFLLLFLPFFVRALLPVRKK